MKKFISLLLCLVMLLSLCACSGEEVTAEQVEEVIEAVEEATPELEALAAQAAELYYSGNFSEVFEALSGLKDSGIGFVTELLSACHYYGYGTEIDPEAAVEMLESVAAEGSAAAKLILADAANTGNGTVQNPEKARELYAEFIRAAEALDVNDTQAGSVFTALAGCYAKGIGSDIDLNKAKTALDKALKNGNLSVFDRIELAEILEEIERIKAKDEPEEEVRYNVDGSIIPSTPKPVSEEIQQAEKLYAEAFEGIQLLAEAGNVKAIQILGDYYLEGLGGCVDVDYERAMELFVEAADEDFAEAQARIAYMYQEGLGVERSYEAAMEWNNRAAMQNNAQAQAQIGYMYHMGLGVTQNLNEAGRWYARAVDQGHPWATEKLAETELTNNQAYFEAHA